MALKWTMRLTKAGMLLGGVYVAVVFIDPARGTIDTNERVKEIVEAVTTNRLDKPLELIPLEIADIRPTPMVEGLRVSGDLEPINRAALHARDGGKIIEVRAVVPVILSYLDSLTRRIFSNDADTTERWKDAGIRIIEKNPRRIREGFNTEHRAGQPAR